MTTQAQNYAYVGVEKCGCVTVVVVDNPAHGKDVRREVEEIREIMKWGHVERVTIESARARFCPGSSTAALGHPHGVCPHPEGCPGKAPTTRSAA